ncbi:MAG: recombinase RecA [Clostridiaceae bacterium]|jgi:recombination protein RecA|nr:recombinase RecA [Clostridiaceae bacterium]
MAQENPKEKIKNLEDALLQIEKQFGKGAVMKMNDKEMTGVEVISTGCLPLDLALGIGGIPKGRIIEIFGPESSGKTTVALHIIAEAQKTGNTCAFIDAEHALDPFYAAKLGVKIDELYIAQPDNGEQALDIVELLVRSQSIGLIVVDSVAALTPQAEIDGEMGDSHMGLHARLMSQALRKLTALADKYKTAILFINQLRQTIQSGYGGNNGPTETTTGGKALKFYASVRIDVRKAESLKDGNEVVGNNVRSRIVKNKMAPPFRVAEFEIIYGQGISKIGCILDMAADLNIIRKSGAFYYYKNAEADGADEKMGQGREKALDYLRNNPEKIDILEKKIKEIKCV